jgi:hypothetical protein
MAEGDGNHSMSNVIARLAAALEKLEPNYTVPDNTIPYRYYIPAIARQLALMPKRGVSPKEMREEAKELAALAKDARSLASRIRKQPPTGDVGLELDATGEFQFKDLADVLNTLGYAAKKIAAAKAAPSGKQGRPTASISDNIVLYLYQEYERITDKPPTLIVRDGKAGGPFLDLVTEVFDALGIETSVEAAIKRVKSARYPSGFPLTPTRVAAKSDGGNKI